MNESDRFESAAKRERVSIMLRTMLAVGAILFMAVVPVNAQSQGDPLPSVAKAVAPPFIPFIFGKTGDTTTVVEVTIDPSGKVRDAHIVEFSLFKDKSFEETAKRWVFAPATDTKQVRTVRLTFVLRIMPKGTVWEELTTIFVAPYQVEVRHEVFDPPINLDPLPNRP